MGGWGLNRVSSEEVGIQLAFHWHLNCTSLSLTTPPPHNSTSSQPPPHNSTSSQLHLLTTPPPHNSTSSQLHLLTTPPPHNSTSSQLHLLTTPPPHNSTSSQLHLLTTPPPHNSCHVPFHNAASNNHFSLTFIFCDMVSLIVNKVVGSSCILFSGGLNARLLKPLLLPDNKRVCKTEF